MSMDDQVAASRVQAEFDRLLADSIRRIAHDHADQSRSAKQVRRSREERALNRRRELLHLDPQA